METNGSCKFNKSVNSETSEQTNESDKYEKSENKKTNESDKFEKSWGKMTNT
jgi:hypothetical protein